MKNLYQYATECIKELNDIGIYPNPISRFEVNSRAKKRWGCCKLQSGIYTIQISSVLLDDNAPVKSLKNTLFHELLHAVDGCMNHGTVWQELADMVNKAYGYHVKRCNSSDELGVEMPTTGKCYIITCNKCHSSWKYIRMTKTVKSCKDNRARCSCGGKNFTVIEKSA
ncbi:MAG: SprT-like domain-containing protein [Bacteroidales bacterium]|nr:SprT-like domain-containing protein [Bacteroidales bacterium]